MILIANMNQGRPAAASKEGGIRKKKHAIGRLFSCALPALGGKQPQQWGETSSRSHPSSTPLSTSNSSSGTKEEDDIQLGRIFRYFDENGDGKISPAELQKCLKATGEDLPTEDIASVVESTDTDGDGLLGMEDFAKLVTAEGEEERSRDLREAFRTYAEQEQECITPRSIGRMLKRLGETRSTAECSAMIRKFDLNGDGVISFDEFKTMMR